MTADGFSLHKWLSVLLLVVWKLKVCQCCLHLALTKPTSTSHSATLWSVALLFYKIQWKLRAWANAWKAAWGLIYGHFEALWKALLRCAWNTFVIKSCPCRLQRVGPPLVRGALYWLGPYAPGHFQSGGAPLSSHLKDNHIENLLTVLHVNGSLSKGTGSF